MPLVAYICVITGFHVLARAVETVLDDQWSNLFLTDGSSMQPFAIPSLLVEDNQHFIVFLHRELHRVRLALEVENRFFSLFREQLGRLIPSCPVVPWPKEDWVPLLFVSLLRVLMTRYIGAWS